MAQLFYTVVYLNFSLLMGYTATKQECSTVNMI